jgi:secreted Zn-dependent insulinase-like peptidase
VEKGRELVSLHLMESPKLGEFITSYPVEGEHLVEKVRYTEDVGAPAAAGRPEEGRRKVAPTKTTSAAGRVWINKAQYFEGVPKAVWEFHIGGYQVCEKWLKDRRGRRLTNDDLAHYQKIVVALNETIRLMREIDEVIPGWPLP